MNVQGSNNSSSVDDIPPHPTKTTLPETTTPQIFDEIDPSPPPIPGIPSVIDNNSNHFFTIIQSCSSIFNQALKLLSSYWPSYTKLATKEEAAELQEENLSKISIEIRGANRVMQKAIENQSLQFIAQGAAKMVWKTEVFNSTNTEKKHVIYTPKSDFFGGKEAEIREEISIAAAIKKNIEIFNKANPKTPVSADNLSINLEVLEGEKKQSIFGNAFAVQAEEATKDLTHMITDSSLDLDTRLNLGRDILSGATALQAAGFLHCDIKPDNFLIVNGRAKLADWGKACKKENAGMHRGNRVYAAPEFKDSPKAEVYSVGLVLIRILEEAILSTRGSSKPNLEELSSEELDRTSATGINLEGVPLLEVEDPSMIVPPASMKPHGIHSKLFGIEKFMTQNEQTYQKDQGLIGRATTMAYYMSGRTNKASLQAAENETHRYIDSLIDIFEQESKLEKPVLQELRTLLKEMTKSDPNQRPSMETALNRYNSILSHEDNFL